MAPTEILHHVPAFVCVASLVDQLGILHLAAPLQGQVSLLLPLLVDAVLVIHHHVLLADLLSCLVLALLDDFALTINLLQGVALLDLVPLHHGLALGVRVLIVWDQIQSHIIEESLFVIIPK